MSDDEATRLRREIRERMDRLEQLDGAPTTREEARRLAAEDPRRLNDLLDAGRVPSDAFAGGEEQQ